MPSTVVKPTSMPGSSRPNPSSSRASSGSATTRCISRLARLDVSETTSATSTLTGNGSTMRHRSPSFSMTVRSPLPAVTASESMSSESTSNTVSGGSGVPAGGRPDSTK